MVPEIFEFNARSLCKACKEKGEQWIANMKRDFGIVQCTPPITKSLTQPAITSLRMRSLSELGPLSLQTRRLAEQKTKNSKREADNQEQQARNIKHRQYRSEISAQ